MTQGILPYKYEAEESKSGITAFAGLGIYLDLAYALCLRKSIERHVHARPGKQGWTDCQMIISLMLLNLAGGESVSDLSKLEADEGIAKLIRHVEWTGKSRQERRALERRWRKKRDKVLPSESAVFRYLDNYWDHSQESLGHQGEAIIPTPSEPLEGLYKVNTEMMNFLQRRSSQAIATLDMDATVVETYKKGALFCYKGFKAYQPFNVYWAEQDFLVYSEFRDGNVPAGFEQLRVLKETLSILPEGVEKVYVRSDTAGYQWNFLKYCAEGKNERFGLIEFAVGVDVTPSFKEAVSDVPDSQWHPIFKEVNGKKKETGQEWAEVCFVPNAICDKKDGPDYRFIAIREAMAEQLRLPCMPAEQLSLPFPTMEMGEDEKRHKYKVFGIVTNRDLPGEELIFWLRKRCGKSEEVHALMKDDLAGGRLPSSDFGANAAWWQIMILALNLNSIMKHLVLGGHWVSKRMKAIRFGIINLAGRVIERSRGLFVRIKAGHPSFDLLLRARESILVLARAPT